MNFQDSYDVAARSQLILSELEWLFSKSGKHPADALFISYAYKGPDFPSYFQELSDIFSKAGIKLTDIASGDPAGLIASTEMIVIGGGDIAALINKMNSLITATFNPYTAIKDRIAGGIFYMGWNEGSSIVSPMYLAPPAGSVPNGIGASPFQIVCHYVNSAQNKNSIFNFLKSNPGIKKVIAQVDQLTPDGTSVRLEDSGAGMIDTSTKPYPAVIRFKIVGGVLNES